jgi:sarcosine oxidase subunit beta
MRPETPQILVTEPAPYRVPPVLGRYGGDIYLRQIPRGNVIFGGGEGRPNEGFTRSRPLPEAAAKACRLAAELVPMLAGLAVIRMWTGVDGTTADACPAVGPSATTPGLFHLFGFSGHGFQIAPAAGAVIAELILDGHTATPIDGLGIGRFRQT